MIRFEDIRVGDRIRVTSSNSDTIIEFTATVANGMDFVGGDSVGFYNEDDQLFELIHRAKPLSTRLADAYGEMVGLNRYQRFAKLVEDFGLDK